MNGPDEELLAIFFGTPPVGQGDWLGLLVRAGNELILRHRFRWYAPDDPDNDPFSGKDEKHWYELRGPGDTPLEEMYDKLRYIMEIGGMQNCDEIIRGDRSMDEMIADMGSRPWCHVKCVTPAPSTKTVH